MALFYLLVALAAVVPHTTALANKASIRHLILKEIQDSLTHLKVKLNIEQTFVQGVLSSENCSPKTLCKAGEVLGAYTAQELGLKQEEWLLPRKLVAYTRDIHCEVSKRGESVDLRQLLRNIELCAKKEYHKP